MDARERGRLVFVWIAALACVLLWSARPAMRGGDGLAAQYYDNPTWTGMPVHSGADPTPSTAQIARRWGDAVPPAFSVVWTGYLAIGRSGVYNFATTSDDGSRLYVDGQLVVDNGGSHGAETRSGRLTLTRGPHPVRLEYVQFGGDFEMTWSWASEDGRYHRVPSWAVSRRAVGYGTALAARVVDLGRWSFALLAGLAATWYLKAWLGVVNVIVVAFVVVAAVPFDPIVSTSYYEYQAHLSFVRRLQWGRDVISTYGPWGFAGLPLFHPITFRWMLLVNALILTITVCRLFVFVRRVHPPGAWLPGLWTAAVLVPLTVIPVAEWSPALFCVPVIAAAISVEWILGRVTFARVDAMSAISLGFLALVKISTWPIAAVLVFASWFQSRGHGLGFTACFLLGTLGGWLAAGQSLMYLGPFFRLGLEVIGGFKDGLAVWGLSDVVAILFIAAAVIPLAVLVLRFPPRHVGQWLGFLVLAAVFGQLFQAAFVRADAQHILSNALGMCAVVPLLVAAVLSSDRRWRSVLEAAAIVSIVMLLFGAAPGSPAYWRPQAEARGLLALVSEGGSSVLNATRERLLGGLAANHPLPARETAGTGAILSGDIGILEGNAVAFSLQPTVASYAAYTRRLEELNTSWLERRGVDWVLWCGPPTVDWRFPTETDGTALLYLATHFGFQSQVGRCSLLRRVSGPQWRAAATEVHRVGFDQLLPIDAGDGSIVWAEISVRETFLGKMMRTLLKPAPVSLRVFEKGGRAFVRDIMPSMTRQGFLLSPLVESWDPLAAVANGRGSGQQLVGLRVEASSLGRFSSDHFYRPEVTVRMTTLRSPRSPQ